MCAQRPSCLASRGFRRGFRRASGRAGDAELRGTSGSRSVVSRSAVAKAVVSNLLFFHNSEPSEEKIARQNSCRNKEAETLVELRWRMQIDLANDAPRGPSH